MGASAEDWSQEMLARWWSIEARARLVTDLITADAPCLTTLGQGLAVRASVAAVSAIQLHRNLDRCLTGIVAGNRPAAREEFLRELVALAGRTRHFWALVSTAVPAPFYFRVESHVRTAEGRL
ncbi:MAG: metal-sensing transcriptional repressor [Actinobacteria bacterium]|nr:metal-sensing transcriptional repressor [Actinomycetota bacterium]